MRRFLTALALILFLTGTAHADHWLVCDPPAAGEAPTVSEVEVTHNNQVAVTPGVVQDCPDGTCVQLLDLAGFPNGNYQFKARWGQPDAQGNVWWSEWSEPSPAYLKAGKPGNVKIKQK